MLDEGSLQILAVTARPEKASVRVICSKIINAMGVLHLFERLMYFVWLHMPAIVYWGGTSVNDRFEYHKWLLENLKLAVRFRVIKGSGRTFLSFVHSVKLVIENKLALILLGYDLKDQDVSEFDFWLTADPRPRCLSNYWILLCAPYRGCFARKKFKC